MTVAALFVLPDTHYRDMGCDCYDADRDARTYAGTGPVIAHPPCRAWSRMRHFAKPRPDEKALAFFARDVVRKNGGVLEHPDASSFWAAGGLPRPGAGRDEFGGWSLAVSQKWWGHRAEKRTWLYIVGCDPENVPVMPLTLGEAPCVCSTSKRGAHLPYRKQLGPVERMRTPVDFARWLVELAGKCRAPA